MSLFLKLELKANERVVITNSSTQEQKNVPLGFLNEVMGNSLPMLIQYRYYELIINAEEHWNKIQRFNPETEKIKEIYLEYKFRDIMANNRWLEINDYERETYYRAVAWANSYNPQKSNSNIDKTAMLAASSGAVTGALASNSIGGVGIAVGGTAFGIGTLGLATMGTIAGLAVYGIGKALK